MTERERLISLRDAISAMLVGEPVQVQNEKGEWVHFTGLSFCYYGSDMRVMNFRPSPKPRSGFAMMYGGIPEASTKDEAIAKAKQNGAIAVEWKEIIP